MLAYFQNSFKTFYTVVCVSWCISQNRLIHNTMLKFGPSKEDPENLIEVILFALDGQRSTKDWRFVRKLLITFQMSMYLSIWKLCSPRTLIWYKWLLIKFWSRRNFSCASISGALTCKKVILQILGVFGSCFFFVSLFNILRTLQI